MIETAQIIEDPTAVYDREIPQRLARPNQRDQAKDAAAREDRRQRTADLQKQREAVSRDEAKLSGTTTGEEQKLAKLDGKYQAIVMLPERTAEAVTLKTEISVRQERLARLQTERERIERVLQDIGAQLEAIAGEEALATAAEEKEALWARLGQKAAHIIEDCIVAGFLQLREICTEARYESDMVQVSDDIVDALRIKLVKQALRYTNVSQSLEVVGVFRPFLLQREWR